MKKVLIITHSSDNECVDKVSEAIKRKGGHPIRFNTDQYPAQVNLNVSYKNSWEIVLKTETETVAFSELESLWYRRIALGAGLKSLLERKYLGPSIEECRTTYFGALACSDMFQLDYHWKVRYSESKQLQLHVASALGLEIPPTLVSNEGEAVRQFYEHVNRSMITKMQGAFCIFEDGSENVVFTNIVKDQDLGSLEEVKYCPMMFQSCIPKKLELRITVVGDRVFAAAIDSQVSEAAKHDWRRDGVRLADAWVKFDLPKDIEGKLLKLMDYFQLNYGAIDMIVTPDDRFLFLEINPAGEFLWIEMKPGYPVSESLADVLLHNAKRRDKRFALEDIPAP